MSIAIIALLLSLLVPALSRARFRARETVGLTTIRQLHQRIVGYADTFGDKMPRIDPEAYYPVGGGATIQFPYWQVHETWVSVLHREFPRWEHLDEIYCPASRFRPDGLPDRYTSYAYSWAFVAPPEYWRESNPVLEGIDRPIRLTDVRYPSAKAMLWDVDAGYYGRPLRAEGFDIADRVGVATVDGAVSLRAPSEAKQAVENEGWPGPDQMKLRNTLDGVHGVDY